MSDNKNNFSKKNSYTRPSIRSKNDNGLKSSNRSSASKLRAQERLNKRREAQSARVISTSLKSKSEKDFNKSNSFFGRFNSKVKRLLVIFLLAVVLLSIGLAIAVFVFFASTSAKLNIDDSAKNKLSSTADGQPY